MPTSASTIVTTKKRVQAPSPDSSEEYEKPVIPKNTSKSTRGQRSKARASRSKSKHTEEIVHSRRGADQVMTENEPSKKRKIQCKFLVSFFIL